LETDAGLAGGLLENFVLMELLKQSSWREPPPQLFTGVRLPDRR
jgi:hypothetical protein